MQYIVIFGILFIIIQNYFTQKQIKMTTAEEVTLLEGIGGQLDAVKDLVIALEALPTDSVPQNVQDALASVKTKSDTLTALIPTPPTA